MEDGLKEIAFGPIIARFRQSLVGHVAAIEHIIEGHSGLDPQAAMDEIAGRAHKVSGVAATLGFEKIGCSASAAEAQVYAMQRTPTFSAADANRLYSLVCDLVELMRAEAA